MGDLLSGIPPLQISAGALLVLVVVLILTGKLVTLRQLRDVQEQRDKAMDLADKWQKVATEAGMTSSKILDGVETITDIVTAIQSGLIRPLDQGPDT